MRVSFVRAATLSILLGAVSLPCLATATGTHSVDDAWAKAMQANDLDAVMKIYAPDAVAWFPDRKEARGTAAIRAAYQGLLSANTVTAVSESAIGRRTIGKTSVGWGNFSMTLQPKAGGAPVVMTGRFSEVAERRNGHWVYVVDHASAEPATEAAGAKQ